MPERRRYFRIHDCAGTGFFPALDMEDSSMIKKSLMKKRILSLFFLSGIIFPYEGPAQKVEFLDGLPSIPYDYS